MRSTLGLIAGLMLPLISFADCSTKACSPVTVDMLYVTANSNILVGTSGDESKLTCGTASEGYVTLLKSSSNFEIMYSTLLASRMASQTVRIRISENTPECSISYLVSE